uniref:Lipoprotein n=1 Tax=Strongyloides stercoralis TaxID=6248 RepID=A0A0K0DY41_STRER
MISILKYLSVLLIKLTLIKACTIPAGSQLVQNPTYQAYVFLPKAWTWDSNYTSSNQGYRKISASIIGSTIQQTSPDAVIKIIDTDVRNIVKDVIKNMGLNFAGANFTLATVANEIPKMSLITFDQVTYELSKKLSNGITGTSTTSKPQTNICKECYVLENNSVKYYIKDFDSINPENIFDPSTGLVPYSQLLTFKTTNTPLYYDFYWDILGDRIRTALQNEGVIFDSTMKTNSNI